MDREIILKEVIEGYRKTINQRYQYQNIKSNYDIPDSIGEETVNQIRNYFLDYVYPEFERRQELNEAFESLDNYIKHPEKLIRVFFDSARLIFSQGRHLPKMLKSGLKAMNTFRAASRFETKLVDEAIKSKIPAPYNISDINSLISLLPRQEIQHFIESAESLFEVLHNKTLVDNIKKAIQQLIEIMKKKKETYSLNEIKGLEVGLEMLTQGHSLFYQLSEDDQKKFVPMIVKIEQDTLDDIFS